MKKFIGLIFLFFLMSQQSFGLTLATTSQTTVNSIGVYSGSLTSSSGDIIITVQNPVSGCDAGFWISGSDPAAQKLLSILLSAKHTSSQIVVNGDKDTMWSGSSGAFCHIYAITDS